MAREMLCFTIETAAGGREGRRVAVMLGYGRLCSPTVGSVSHWEVQLQVVKRIVRVASRWRWVAIGGAVLLVNAIEGFHGGAALLGNASGNA